MALTKLAKISDNSFWAVWKIEESLAGLIDLLHPSMPDLQYLNDLIHHPKKKLEWMAGRLALDCLLQHIGIKDYHVIKDNHGKPFLCSHDIHISLANSFPYATAIINTKFPVGIDIEQPSSKLLKVSRKFLSSAELSAAQADYTILCAFWCAKEAIYKVYGRKQLSFKDHILINFSQREPGLLGASVSSPFYSTHHELILEMIDSYYVCYNIN